MPKRSKLKSVLLVVAIAAVVIALRLWPEFTGGASAPPVAPASSEAPAPAVQETLAASAIDEAFREGRSGLMVEASGVVERILSDDNEGSRHQRFVVRLPSGTTVLIAHNIDLAPRVPAREGAEVRFRGQYEWNDKGGVIHWTHHDPDGRHDEGWIEYGGSIYR